MALAVGMANSEVEFVFPTSEEMGHPSFDVPPSSGIARPGRGAATSSRVPVDAARPSALISVSKLRT